MRFWWALRRCCGVRPVTLNLLFADEARRVTVQYLFAQGSLMHEVCELQVPISGFAVPRLRRILASYDLRPKWVATRATVLREISSGCCRVRATALPMLLCCSGLCRLRRGGQSVQKALGSSRADRRSGVNDRGTVDLICDCPYHFHIG